MDFAVPADLKKKLKENEKKEKYLDQAKEIEKKFGDTNCNWCTRHSHQRIDIGTVRLRNKSKSGDHPNYSIFKIGLNNEKNFEDMSDSLSLKFLWKTID